MAIITLLTDFGLDDTYVGQVKGAVLSIASSATLVDLTHAVPVQDVVAGAYLLWTAVGAFPPKTIHLAVVDPGVGSSRRAIAARTGRGDYLVGPDNGLLTPAAERLGGIQQSVELATPTSASATFHGRDVFGPAAARLAQGASLADLGAPASDLVHLALPQPTDDAGEVIHVDTYGNLVTNIRREQLRHDSAVVVGHHVASIVPYYAAVAPNELLALVGSAGLLEISVRDGSAAERTGARRGTAVRLSRQRPQE